MRFKTKSLTGYFLIILMIPVNLFGYSAGPPDNTCGNPPFYNNCTECHSDYPVNSGTGTIYISNLPDQYVQGGVYNLTITLEDPQAVRWGFELTVMSPSGHAAGVLTATDPANTQLSDNPGSDPDFLKQTLGGTSIGTTGSMTWEFEWRAPLDNLGAVFFFAGNGSDNSGSSAGDYIYVDEAGVPAAGVLPLQVIATVPIINEPMVNPEIVVNAQFNLDVLSETINVNTFTISGSVSGSINGNVEYDERTRTAVFTPEADLFPGEEVVAHLDQAISATNGQNLLGGYEWNFWIIRTGEIDISFTDIAASAGLGVIEDSQGPLFFDENGDGIEDIYLCVGGNPGGENVFYRNNGDLTFTDETSIVGLEESGSNTMSAAGDFNNDGLLDIYIVDHEGVNQLYFKQNSGVFENVTASSGTGNPNENHDAMFWDYNMDGWLDIFVLSANHTGPQGNALYRNNGDGTFTDVAPDLGLDLEDEWGMGACAGDYDNDGDPDIYISNEFEANHLFRNDDGDFTDVTEFAGVAGGGVGKAVYFEDYDKDGWLDLFYTSRFETNQLFRNNGDGTFTDVTYQAGLQDNSGGRTCGWGDFDNDGWLDIFVCNNNTSNDLLWRNNGDMTFDLVNESAGIDDYGYSDGYSIGDANMDGFLDMYISNIDIEDKLYLNSGNLNHWINITAAGRTSTNYSGVGARITVVRGDSRQIREVQAGGGIQSAHSLPSEFGLGADTAVDSLIIRWTDGHIEYYTNIEADNHYVAVEDSGLTTLYPSAVDIKSTTPQSYSMLAVYPNPFNQSAIFSFGLSESQYITAALYDLLGRNVRQISQGVYSSGNHDLHIDGGDLSSGVYFIRLETEHGISVLKTLLLR